MTMTTERAVRRVATYERVSSEDQRERETIKTQTEELARSLARQPDIELVERFVDDGVSGTIPLAERPAGGRLMRDAAAGQFEELHVYKFDRLGRDADRPRPVVRALRSISASASSASSRASRTCSATTSRRWSPTTAAASSSGSRPPGMERAAREGRYTGGIVPFGYRVEGTKQMARLVPDTAPLWADRSAADVVRQIYHWLALEGWSCVRVAAELNALGVPTHYVRDGRQVKRGQRHERTQGVWRHGRIRNLVVNPVYKGELLFGRRIDQRSKRRRGHEVISAQIEPLVSPEVWQAAQDTLARNRTIARNVKHSYLLRGVIHCAACSLTYIGSQGREGVSWYRCGGRDEHRGPLDGKCRNPMLRGEAIEQAVWSDIEAWLRNPGDVLADLESEVEQESEAAIAAAELITLRRALDSLEAQRSRVLALRIRGHLTEGEADAELDRISGEQAALRSRVSALEAPRGLDVPESAHDLLDEVRRRLDAGLTDEQRQEIVRLLVAVRVEAVPAVEGRRPAARAIVEYRFPSPRV